MALILCTPDLHIHVLLLKPELDFMACSLNTAQKSHILTKSPILTILYTKFHAFTRKKNTFM